MLYSPFQNAKHPSKLPLPLFSWATGVCILNRMVNCGLVYLFFVQVIAEGPYTLQWSTHFSSKMPFHLGDLGPM